MYQTMEAELNSGPPVGVMMLISVKICDPPMMLVTTRKNVTGRTIGRVMCRNRCKALAPSSAAAS